MKFSLPSSQARVAVLLVGLAVFASACEGDSPGLDMSTILDMHVKDLSVGGCTVVDQWPSDDVGAQGDVIADSPPFTFRTLGFAYQSIGAQTNEIDIEVWAQPTTPPTPRTVPLPADGNYTNCDTCVVLYEDLDDTGAWGTFYFARGGTVNIAKADTNVAGGDIQVTASNVHLVEWDYNQDVPVQKGKCYDVGSISITSSYQHDNADGGADM